MNKKLFLMSEVDLKAFSDGSRDLREASLKMTAEEVKLHTKDILEQANINELIKGEALKLEVDINGVAHIPIQGMLTNNVSPSAGFFGEFITTYHFIVEAIAQAEEIPAIKSIVLEVDSGGGDISGLEVAANAIFTATKPVIARVHSMAGSAAFWLVSQADRIVAVGRTSDFGSIGVAALFVDRSAQDKAKGKKTIVLTSNDAPEKILDITTAQGQEATIKRLNEKHIVFVDHIVRGISPRRPEVTAEHVRDNFGRGSIMAADAAFSAGMIDEIEGVSSKTINVIPGESQAADTTETNQLKEEEMNLTEFLASSPDARAEQKILIEKAKMEGAAEVKANLQVISEKVLPVITSGSYSKRIINAGMEACSGARELQNFQDLVAYVDEENENKKSEKVKKDQPAETPGEDNHDTGKASSITSPAVQETIKVLKEKLNV